MKYLVGSTGHGQTMRRRRLLMLRFSFSARTHWWSGTEVSQICQLPRRCNRGANGEAVIGQSVHRNDSFLRLASPTPAIQLGSNTGCLCRPQQLAEDAEVQ
jgi:hypothetical protein